MIKNAKQYASSKKWITRFEETLKVNEKSKEKLPTVVFNAMQEGIISQIAELRKEVNLYEKSKTSKTIQIRTIEEIPIALIKARIAKGLTHAELAKLLRIKYQQIQRYEATNYKNVGFDRLIEVVHALGITFDREIALKI